MSRVSPAGGKFASSPEKWHILRICDMIRLCFVSAGGYDLPCWPRKFAESLPRPYNYADMLPRIAILLLIASLSLPAGLRIGCCCSFQRSERTGQQSDRTGSSGVETAPDLGAPRCPRCASAMLHASVQLAEPAAAGVTPAIEHCCDCRATDQLVRRWAPPENRGNRDISPLVAAHPFHPPVRPSISSQVVTVQPYADIGLPASRQILFCVWLA